jgi:hypothetical protein
MLAKIVMSLLASSFAASPDGSIPSCGLVVIVSLKSLFAPK